MQKKKEGMTRGNQREQNRLRAQKLAAGRNKGNKDETPLTQRKDRDADIMRQKQAAAEARKAAEAAGGAKGGKK